MKKSVILASALLAMAFTGQAVAAPSSVGVVNVAQILQSSKKVEDATKMIQDKFAKRQETIKAQQDDLQASMGQLKKDGAVMKSEDKKKLEEKIEGQRKKLLSDIGVFQKELSEEQNASMKRIFGELNKVVEHVAHADKLDVVFDSQFVVYAGDKQNITEQVKKEFNKSASAKK